MGNDKKFWEKAAKFYNFFMRKSKKSNILLKDIISKYIKEDMKVLELGCGTGQLSFLLGDICNNLISTDFSSEMIRLCEKRNSGNVKFKIEDAGDLSFKDNCFDVVIASNILHIVSNPDEVVNEVKRVLKDDGIFFAPIYTDDSRKNDLRIKLLGEIGFKVYNNFSSEEYVKYLTSKGFELIYHGVIKEKPLDECVVVLKYNVG